MRRRGSVGFLPYHLKHHSHLEPRVGRGRSAGGINLRGVVLKTYLPGDPANKPRLSLEVIEHPGVTCDVMILEPGYVSILRHVPMLRTSGGLNDTEQWVPRASTIDILTAVMTISPEGVLGIPVSDAADLDGDFVLVGFMNDDMNQPVILGQMDHPRANKKVSFFDLVKFPYKRSIRGLSWGVNNTGNIEIDMTAPTDGTVLPGLGNEVIIPPPIGGNITVTLAPLGMVSIVDSILSLPDRALMGDTYLTSLSTFQTSEAAWLASASAVWGASNTFALACSAFGTAVNLDPLLAPATKTAATTWATAAGAWAGAATTYLSTLATHIGAQSVFSTEVTTSLGVGLPFLSSHLEFD